MVHWLESCSGEKRETLPRIQVRRVSWHFGERMREQLEVELGVVVGGVELSRKVVLGLAAR